MFSRRLLSSRKTNRNSEICSQVTMTASLTICHSYANQVALYMLASGHLYFGEVYCPSQPAFRPFSAADAIYLWYVSAAWPTSAKERENAQKNSDLRLWSLFFFLTSQGDTSLSSSAAFDVGLYTKPTSQEAQGRQLPFATTQPPALRLSR